MAALFISYAHEDRPFVVDLARALAEAGHTVWWDRALDVGGAFRQQIQSELDAATLVLVAWSGRSRLSRFVADEADVALAQGKLLPLLIDGTRPPLGFGGLHAVDLSRWPRTADDAAFAGLLQAIDQRLSQGPQPPPARPRAALRGPATAMLLAGALGFGLAQAGVHVARPGVAPPWELLRFTAEHTALAALLLVPAAAHAVHRTRALGLSSRRALWRPFAVNLLGGALLAALLGLLALAAGAAAQRPPGERLADGTAALLLATPCGAALVALLRWAWQAARRPRP